MRKMTNLTWVILATAPSVVVGCSSDPSSDNDAQSTALSVAACTEAPSRALGEQTEFFSPATTEAAKDQAKALLKARQFKKAADVMAMQRTPHAAWFSGGTPAEVRAAVHETMQQAARRHEVPVLVAYNLPYRDCSQYSAGGAADTAAYKAWIDGFAAGIGKGKAGDILEPDGLGIIPYNTTIYGSADWCKPTVTDAAGVVSPAPGANAEERYAQLNYAVDSIEGLAARAAVYLDASHSGWLGVGEAGYRLKKAGVVRAQGFFLNVSNYQLTSESIQFGKWVSAALAAAAAGPAWAYDSTGNFHFDWLPGQYDPASNYTVVNYNADYVASVDAGLAPFLNGAVASTHFVIDTSRNGRGPLDATRYGNAPYNQPPAVVAGLKAGNWCNPSGAGVGLRPTAKTDVSLLDAYLWVKVPGESDGSCDVAGGARAWDFTAYNPWQLASDAQSHFDPLWAMVDPQAGAWFPEQALQLAQNANPPLR